MSSSDRTQPQVPWRHNATGRFEKLFQGCVSSTNAIAALIDQEKTKDQFARKLKECDIVNSYSAGRFFPDGKRPRPEDIEDLLLNVGAGRDGDTLARIRSRLERLARSRTAIVRVIICEATAMLLLWLGGSAAIANLQQPVRRGVGIVLILGLFAPIYIWRREIRGKTTVEDRLVLNLLEALREINSSKGDTTEARVLAAQKLIAAADILWAALPDSLGRIDGRPLNWRACLWPAAARVETWAQLIRCDMLQQRQEVGDGIKGMVVDIVYGRLGATPNSAAVRHAESLRPSNADVGLQFVVATPRVKIGLAFLAIVAIVQIIIPESPLSVAIVPILSYLITTVLGDVQTARDNRLQEIVHALEDVDEGDSWGANPT